MATATKKDDTKVDNIEKELSAKINSIKDSTNREFKSSVFAALFSAAANALELYNAIDNANCTNTSEIDYRTLEGVLFLARKNDVAFTVSNRILVISEHQSTINHNMPLRDAIYYGRTMEQIMEAQSMFRSKMVKIPTPEFFVFYNGESDRPSEEILRLSDAFIEEQEEPMMEVLVKVININSEANHPILLKCQPLKEYTTFMELIRDLIKQGDSREDAVKKSITECRRIGILTDFLNVHGKEVDNMLFTQFNMEDALRIRGEEEHEDGVEEGIEKGIEKGKTFQEIILIKKKYEKGYTSREAADMLETEEQFVEKVYNIMKENPSYSEKDIVKLLDAEEIS